MESPKESFVFDSHEYVFQKKSTNLHVNI
jgi:hypothetical protein